MAVYRTRPKRITVNELQENIDEEINAIESESVVVITRGGDVAGYLLSPSLYEFLERIYKGATQ